MAHDFEYCTGCGLCHSVYNIPFERDGKNFLKPSQKKCRILKKMNDICPFGKYGVSKYSGNVWGEYISACRAYSADNGIRRKASSGGVITSLAIYLLRTKKVDGVILTKADENMPYHCVTFCARTEEEILSACGSRYSQSSPLMDILSLIKHDEKYCFIGKPCDVSTLRRYLKYNPLLENRIVFMLSFFCAGMPSDQANEKLLYAIITSLACKEGYCFASNKYLAEKLDVNPKTVSSWISDLRDRGFIIVELIRNENNQIIQRKIYINDSPYPLNNGYQYQSKNGQAIYQKVEDNNIRNNIKNSNKVKKKIISNYTNRREYSEEFLNSLYANFNM